MRHAQPSILALDLGTQTGWAVLSQGKIISGTFDMRPAQGEPIGVRFLKFRREFLRTFRGVREVYYEEVRRHEGTHAAHIYGGLWAIMCAWCEENVIPYRGVEVAHWKQHITGRGNSGKEAIFEAIKARGFEPDSFDEADALGILSYARSVRGAA